VLQQHPSSTEAGHRSLKAHAYYTKMTEPIYWNLKGDCAQIKEGHKGPCIQGLSTTPRVYAKDAEQRQLEKPSACQGQGH
jgi:hypothetical protein